nr:hypothetical protein [Tanacetum cinerariifolium]
MASSSNCHGNANTTRPWTKAEEIMLCTAWCNAMEMYGLRDITKKGVWKDVFDNDIKTKDFIDVVKDYYYCWSS